MLGWNENCRRVMVCQAAAGRFIVGTGYPLIPTYPALIANAQAEVVKNRWGRCNDSPRWLRSLIALKLEAIGME